MTPEEIRRLYAREQPATAEEAAATTEAARTDADTARALIEVVFSLARTDPASAILAQFFTQEALRRLIIARAAADDAFALDCGRIITDLQEQMSRPQRGKPRRTAKTA